MTDRIDGQTALVPLPTLPGRVHGIVGERPGEGRRGRTEYDLQCDGCGAIETLDILATMTTLFWKCQRLYGNSERLCPDCHTDVHLEGVDCR